MPGLKITLGFTVFYLSIIVLLPIAALVLRAFHLSWAELWTLATNERALAAYELSLGASLAAALINALFGSLLAWVLVRYRFPGRRLLDGLIDFPFALPTAVAGLTLANLFADHGWLGQFLVPLGIQGAFTRLGVVIALTFVGLPFSVPDASARSRKPGPRRRGSRGLPWRQPVSDVRQRHRAHPFSHDFDRVRPVLRPRPGGIRLDQIHFRESAANRDRARCSWSRGWTNMIIPGPSPSRWC